MLGTRLDVPCPRSSRPARSVRSHPYASDDSRRLSPSRERLPLCSD